MSHLHRGKVEFFNRQKGWGFITPNEGKKPNGKGVFFHVADLCGVTDNFMCVLDLMPLKEAVLAPEYHDPRPGEEIVYTEMDDGFTTSRFKAVQWTYGSTYDRGDKMITIREQVAPCLWVPYIRVMCAPTKEGKRPRVIWKGNEQEFGFKLTMGFPFMFSSLSYVEKLNIASRWVRTTHPVNWHSNYRKAS